MSDRRNVLITGASQGLGRAMAVEFARTGHRVFGCARNAERLDALRDELGGDHRFTPVDVAIDAAVAAWASDVLGEAGPPHLIVNNAALINANAPLWSVSAEEFGAVIDVNLKGVHHVVRHFLPAMIGRGSGVIVNVSSGWGRSVAPEVAPYCATKWGVEGLTRALAEELPPGLAAVPLNPGVIHTEMLESCFGPSASSYAKPDEWATTAVPFLLRLGPSDNGRPATAP